MKTKEQLIERYDHLFDKMKDSENEYKEKVFLDSGKQMFKELASMQPDIANRWLDKLEAVCWNNYLSEMECKNISMHIINQDGTKGFHWEYPTFDQLMDKIDEDDEQSPYFNCYALLATINMIYSDHAESIAEDMGHAKAAEVPVEKMFRSCYRKAVEKLKDKDRPFFIRKHFKHEM